MLSASPKTSPRTFTMSGKTTRMFAALNTHVSAFQITVLKSKNTLSWVTRLIQSSREVHREGQSRLGCDDTQAQKKKKGKDKSNDGQGEGPPFRWIWAPLVRGRGVFEHGKHSDAFALGSTKHQRVEGCEIEKNNGMEKTCRSW